MKCFEEYLVYFKFKCHLKVFIFNRFDESWDMDIQFINFFESIAGADSPKSNCLLGPPWKELNSNMTAVTTHPRYVHYSAVSDHRYVMITESSFSNEQNSYLLLILWTFLYRSPYEIVLLPNVTQPRQLFLFSLELRYLLLSLFFVFYY